MPQSESIGKLADALSKAQAQLKAVTKDLTVNTDKYSYTYADLASVWNAIREPLTSNGLSVVQLPMGGTNGNVNLITVLMHVSGEWVSSDFTMKPVTATPQAVGSCLTYARRYVLAAMTGVATEDDDAQEASVPTTQQKAVQAPGIDFRKHLTQKAAVPDSRPVSEAPPTTESVSDERHGGPANGFIWHFGKTVAQGGQRGRRLEEIPDDYLVWASKFITKDPEHKAAAIMELDRRNGQEIFAGSEADTVDLSGGYEDGR